MSVKDLRYQVAAEGFGKMVGRKLFWSWQGWLLIPAALLCLSCKNIDQAAFDKGMDAYARGDFKTAMEEWRPLAERGNPSAQTNLGVMYYQGRGVRPDSEEAMRWYRLAALKGYPEAYYNMGVAYTEGKGVEQSSEEALRWYKAAAEGGYVAAQLLLGNLYSRGQGVEADAKEAARWFQAAADQGDSTAQFLLATAYLSGNGVDQDDVQAYKWLTITAERGNDQAKASASLAMQRLAERMEETQIAEAKRLANEWLATINAEGN
ncbi:MAG: sel1 repeat family protein [Acidobacteria bacterium]|nr:sel1 repeat family protein [Acidobacteriota bacterium]